MRGPAAAGGSGGAEERGRHVLHELRSATAVLRARCERRAAHSTRSAVHRMFSFYRPYKPYHDRSSVNTGVILRTCSQG